MTANEKLVELLENDKLTDDQQDALNDWNIERASDVKIYLIDLVKELQGETDSIDYEKAVIALYDLLDYNDDDYVVYDEDGVSELEFDTLDDALDVD